MRFKLHLFLACWLSDVGLSDIDPRRLAAGDWEEVVFIGQLLCWLGKQMGFLRSSRSSLSTDPPPERAISRSSGRASAPRVASVSTHSALSASPLFISSALEVESNTTMLSMTSDFRQNSEPHEGTPISRHRQPQCIHEVDTDSFFGVAPEPSSHVEQGYDNDILGGEYSRSSYCSCAGHDDFSIQSRASLPVRYDGYIEEVDTEHELQAFENLRSSQSSSDDFSRLKSNSNVRVQLTSATPLTNKHFSP